MKLLVIVVMLEVIYTLGERSGYETKSQHMHTEYLTSFVGAGINLHNSPVRILLILITDTIVHTHSDDVGGN